MFAQDSTLVGDVDCSGEVNSQDASLILQFVTNVIDSLPCEVNMTGLTPDQLQEMIDMMDEQLSINYTGGSEGGCDFLYPEGLSSDFVSFNPISNPYTVPIGKRLYVFYSGGPTTNNFFIDGDIVTYNNNGQVIIDENQVVSSFDDLTSTFINGMLVNRNDNLETAILEYNTEFTSYTVPSNKSLVLLSANSTGNVIVDGLNSSVGIFNLPFVLNESQTIEIPNASGSLIGYLVDEDYFADCSGGGGSTTNSVAEIGGSGVDFTYPDGFNNLEPVYFHGDHTDDEINEVFYTVPDGRNLYLTHVSAQCGARILYSNGNFLMNINNSSSYKGKTPFIIESGAELSMNLPCGDGQEDLVTAFSGFLVDAIIEPKHISLLDSNYVVPQGKILCIYYSATDLGNSQFFINDTEIFEYGNSQFYDISHSPLLIDAGDTISVISENVSTQSLSSVHGYLVDEDYFSSAGNSSSTSNTSSSNLATGVGSSIGLDDFDKEYDMFDLQISWFDDKFKMDVDENNNVYIAVSYEASSSANCSIGGQALNQQEGGNYSIAIVKYDSVGVIQYLKSHILLTSESYQVMGCSVEAVTGNLFVTGTKSITSNGYFSVFLRKYDVQGNLLFEKISDPTYKSCRSNDVISDDNGGAYICGFYQEPLNFGNGVSVLPNDIGNFSQAFIARIDQNGNTVWAKYVGDTSYNDAYDDMQSLAIDINNNILVSGTKDNNSSYNQWRTFIRKYEPLNGGLLNEYLSDYFDQGLNSENAVRINVDNNGDIYLFTSATYDYSASNPSYIFNLYPLSFTGYINGNILYKLSSSFTHLYSHNFGNGHTQVNQVIPLSDNNVVLRTKSSEPLIINNVVYSQDINQAGYVMRLNNNGDFVKFHTLGYLGATESRSINANSSNMFTFYSRSANFINNGITYPVGNYLVKESY